MKQTNKAETFIESDRLIWENKEYDDLAWWDIYFREEFLRLDTITNLTQEAFYEINKRGHDVLPA